MADPETTYYQDPQGVLITSVRAQIGAAMYPLAQITAVQSVVLPPDRTIEFAVFFSGLVLGGIVAAAVDGILGATIAGAAVVLGIYASLRARPFHVVRLATAGGQVDAVKDKDGERVVKIIAALQHAIIRRG